jgi:hypothetical protein
MASHLSREAAVIPHPLPGHLEAYERVIALHQPKRMEKIRGWNKLKRSLGRRLKGGPRP